MKSRTLIFALGAFLASCGGKQHRDAVPADAAGSEPAGSAETVVGKQEVLTDERIKGSWESDACGERTYTRTLIVYDEKGFYLVDSIAPCPPGTLCAWSGVKTYHGSWKVHKGNLVLEYEKPVEGLPSVFSHSGLQDEEGLVVEDGIEAGCRFTRKQDNSHGGAKQQD